MEQQLLRWNMHAGGAQVVRTVSHSCPHSLLCNPGCRLNVKQRLAHALSSAVVPCSSDLCGSTLCSFISAGNTLLVPTRCRMQCGGGSARGAHYSLAHHACRMCLLNYPILITSARRNVMWGDCV
eukprot:scaffold19556_cov21-Tisochrysis_lutea.AAC.1